MGSAETPAFVVTISGSDASGGAGLQADNRAIHAMGAFPLNVITALTLQTGQGLQSIDYSPPELVRMHLVSLLNTYPVEVVKAGMLGNAAIVNVLAETLETYPEIRLVLDPVLRASSGRPLLDQEGVDSLLNALLKHTYLITPNLPELALLTGLEAVESWKQEEEAVKILLAKGCQAVLVKGGHRSGSTSIDRLFSKLGVKEFSTSRVKTEHTRGTGCALASLIAAGLAEGNGLEESVNEAKQTLFQSLQAQESNSWPGNGPAFF
ncbi:MAG: bifunctional hydroxymethylpyrimidine kinase/phosphomethylpyrimidine kinase [Verrucomicrobia bacterium]|nr:bifunctional hydroxymethylpyrimidine kinase/phosphomethylpyrimidine kinase [Verrucomicrobiota bacterium]